MKLKAIIIFLCFCFVNRINGQGKLIIADKPMFINDSFFINVPYDSIKHKLLLISSFDSISDMNLSIIEKTKYEKIVANKLIADTSFKDASIFKNFSKIYRTYYWSKNGSHLYIIILYSFPKNLNLSAKCNCKGVNAFINENCEDTIKYITVLDSENRFDPLIFIDLSE